MTLIEKAKKGQTNSLIRKIAKIEKVSAKDLCKHISRGHIVIPKNKIHALPKPCGIGKGLKTKVNVNIGTSPDFSSTNKEVKKLTLSINLGADTIMDLSVGKNLRETRKRILEISPIPLGTVPIYEVAVNAKNDIAAIKESDIINILKIQAKEGVDFFTIHAGITKKTIKVLQKSKRLIDMVSRGGAIIYKWMITHNKENPLYSRFDEVIDIAREFDITLSLGDGMRPGAIADATDEAQIEELKTLGELQERALKKGVQVIIEGPGHIPINEIKKNVDLEKSICHGAPFYVLGPLVIDVAPGYDHITSAIGGAMAAACGADFLCYVTPSEHLRLPTIQDVKEGLIASKIAAHAADVAKGKKEVLEQDISISKARRKRNWKEQFALSLDPVKAIEYRRKSIPSHTDVCTMCSEYCPIKISQRYKKK